MKKRTLPSSTEPFYPIIYMKILLISYCTLLYRVIDENNIAEVVQGPATMLSGADLAMVSGQLPPLPPMPLLHPMGYNVRFEVHYNKTNYFHVIAFMTIFAVQPILLSDIEKFPVSHPSNRVYMHAIIFQTSNFFLNLYPLDKLSSSKNDHGASDE